MKTYENGMAKLMELMGTATVIAWSLLLGPVGAVLIFSISRVLLSDRPLALIVCVLVAALPLVLGIIWSLLACACLTLSADGPLRERVLNEYSPVRGAAEFTT